MTAATPPPGPSPVDDWYAWSAPADPWAPGGTMAGPPATGTPTGVGTSSPVPAGPHVGHTDGFVIAPQTDRFSRFVLSAYARSPRWAAPLAVLACFLGAAGLVWWDHPASADAASTPTCLVKLTTGFDCPGCGGTRAFWYLMRGDVAAAARSHLIAVFAAPFLVYMYVAWVANSVFGRRLPVFRPSPRALSIFLAAWGAFSVLRNLPWAPFTWFYV